MSEMHLQLTSGRDEYESTKDRLVAFFRERGLSEEAIGELELVLEEVLVNIISYAYDEGGAGRISVSARLGDGEATLEFRDRGKPFDPLEREAPDLDASIEDRPIGGLGIFLVKELASRVAYERSEGCNVLTVSMSV